MRHLILIGLNTKIHKFFIVLSIHIDFLAVILGSFDLCIFNGRIQELQVRKIDAFDAQIGEKIIQKYLIFFSCN